MAFVVRAARPIVLLLAVLLARSAPAALTPVMYVSDGNTGDVFVVDLNTNTVWKRIPAGVGPLFGIALSPDGSTVYTAGGNTDTLAVIDTWTHTVSNRVAVGRQPREVAVSPDSRFVYIAERSSFGIGVVDAVTNTRVAEIPTDIPGFTVALSPDGERLYTTSVDLPTLSVVDTARRVVIATVAVGDNGAGLAVGDDGVLYVARAFFGGPTFPDPLVLVDTSSNTVITSIPGDLAAGGFQTIALHPDGRSLYLAHDGQDGFTVFDTVSRRFVKSLALEGDGPTGVAVHPDGTYAYATNSWSPITSTSGFLSVIDTATNTLKRHILRVGHAPRRIVTGRVELACGNGTLEADEQCDDGNRFDGDGCAANCRDETVRELRLDPQVSRITLKTLMGEFAGAVSGSLRIHTASPDEHGSIRVTIKTSDVQLNPVPITGVGCACIDVMPEPDLGPGNAGHGEIGCGEELVRNVWYSNSQNHNSDQPFQDPDCFRGTREPPDGRHPGVCNAPIRLFFINLGAPGSAVIESHLGFRIIADGGTCAVDAADPAKGPDGVPCSGDDPDAGRRIALQPLTTGLAQALVASPDNNTRQEEALELRNAVLGDIFECQALAANPTSGTGGAVLTSAVPVLDLPLGDTVVTTVFGVGPVRTSTPTPSRTPTPTPTPTDTRTPRPTRTATLTVTATRTRTATLAPSPTARRTTSATPTCTRTPSPTPTPTPAATVPPTPTLPPTATPTRTATLVPTVTRSPSPTIGRANSGGGCSMSGTTQAGTPAAGVVVVPAAYWLTHRRRRWRTRG